MISSEASATTSHTRNPKVPLLEAAGLCLSYGATPALSEASLRLVQGEIVALVGPSGSGKTSLLHCMAGLTVPQSGAVFFSGKTLTGLTEDQRTIIRREHFGFVLQFGHLVPDLTLVENVGMPLLLLGKGRRTAFSRARELLHELGMTAAGERYPGQVSGGQQQRAAVARALISEPDVIFADEPTGALDVANGDRVMDLLTNQARERRTSVLVVTHDHDRLAGVDRVVTLVDGRTDGELRECEEPGCPVTGGSP